MPAIGPYGLLLGGMMPTQTVHSSANFPIANFAGSGFLRLRPLPAGATAVPGPLRGGRAFVVSTLGMLMMLAVGTGCKPDYPSCETDKDCHSQEFCVANKCQQCRQDTDCGQGQSCKAGKCEAIPGFCTSKAQCPANQECIASRCRPCASDNECPSGARCWNGTCSSQKHCKKDDDCAQDEDCQNQVCVKDRKPPPAPTACTLEPVYFDFNESALTTTATDILARDADCLKKMARAVSVNGHADPRGTAEYNIALSERRAQSAQSHLERLGVDGAKMSTLARGSLDAKGTDEPSWAQDRRVDFGWR